MSAANGRGVGASRASGRQRKQNEGTDDGVSGAERSERMSSTGVARRTRSGSDEDGGRLVDDVPSCEVCSCGVVVIRICLRCNV